LSAALVAPALPSVIIRTAGSLRPVEISPDALMITGFDLARELTGLFWDVYRAAEGEFGGPVSTPASTERRHQLIVHALRTGDPELAAEAVHRHFDEVRERANAGRYGGFGTARPTAR
jgi:hypothetical protein